VENTLLPSQATASKECMSCHSEKPMYHFRRDSSIRDGHTMQCDQCLRSPRLSTVEHTYRLRELTAGSDAIRRQKRPHQEDFKGVRTGASMHHSEFIRLLRSISDKLYIMDGNIEGDLAIFKILGGKLPENERDFEYIGYMPTGVLPEFSDYLFDQNDVLVKEKKRGWRTVLLRLIKSRVITEEQCDQAFGPVTAGPAGVAWRREMFVFRNGHE
jgi:hypothetical protein